MDTVKNFEASAHRSKVSFRHWQEVMLIIAFASMVIDHLGLFIFENNEWMRLVGRLSFPLFAFVFGVRLASKSATSQTVEDQVDRLVVMGCASQYMWVSMAGHNMPLNIFFAFIAAIALIEGSKHIASSLGQSMPPGNGVVFGMFLLASVTESIDYGVLGVCMILCAYGIEKNRSAGCVTGFAVFAAMCGLTPAGQTIPAYAYPLVAALSVPASLWAASKTAWLLTHRSDGADLAWRLRGWTNWGYPLHIIGLAALNLTTK